MMYLRDKEHNPPHIHAFYGNEAVSFYISNGEIYEGSFPNRTKKMGKEFVLKYQKGDLVNNVPKYHYTGALFFWVKGQN